MPRGRKKGTEVFSTGKFLRPLFSGRHDTTDEHANQRAHRQHRTEPPKLKHPPPPRKNNYPAAPFSTEPPGITPPYLAGFRLTVKYRSLISSYVPLSMMVVSALSSFSSNSVSALRTAMPAPRPRMSGSSMASPLIS